MMRNQSGHDLGQPKFWGGRSRTAAFLLQKTVDIDRTDVSA